MSDRIIVDENDQQIGAKSHDEMRYKDMYRVSALWVTDKNTGKHLLAQRQKGKRNDPNKWAAAVAGTVEDGETYEENILKEAQEELGLEGLELSAGPKQYVDDGNHRFFCQWYLAAIDKDTTPLIMQEEEVQAVAWFDGSQLRADVIAHPEKYTPSTMRTLDLLDVR